MVSYPPAPEPFVLSSNSKPPAVFIDTLRSEVSKEYCQVAQNPELGFHFHTVRRVTTLLEYQDHWLEGLPEEVIESFAGTGNPFRLWDILPGEKVVDTGCGAGLDCIIVAKMAGVDGKIIGADMTQEMVDKAQSNVAATGVKNVTIKQGISEELLVDDGWADIVISNGAINLAPDKDDIFRELNRVLKPGDRLQVADILGDKPIPEGARRNIDLWTG